MQDVGTFFEAHAPASAPLRTCCLDAAVTSAKTPFVLENVQALRLDNVALGDQRLDGEHSVAVGQAR